METDVALVSVLKTIVIQAMAEVFEARNENLFEAFEAVGSAFTERDDMLVNAFKERDRVLWDLAFRVAMLEKKMGR